jgi:hypothetical protein
LPKGWGDPDGSGELVGDGVGLSVGLAVGLGLSDGLIITVGVGVSDGALAAPSRNRAYTTAITITIAAIRAMAILSA